MNQQIALEDCFIEDGFSFLLLIYVKFIQYSVFDSLKCQFKL